jgi:hypothetical protein
MPAKLYETLWAKQPLPTFVLQLEEAGAEFRNLRAQFFQPLL